MIQKQDKTTYSIALEIAEVGAQDGGEYKAIAKNEHGESTATITLNFEGTESTMNDYFLFAKKFQTMIRGSNLLLSE